MASQTSFKQQCPSCEAMVPIKDSSLVGKKVDCPKCKYRFVVEDPGAGDEAPSKSKVRKAGDPKGKVKGKTRPDEEADGKKKKPEKKGKPTMLIVGVALGLVAVIGLIVGAILLFGSGSDDKKPSGGGGGGQQGNRGGTTGSSGTGAASANANGGTNTNAGSTSTAPAPDRALVTASNLLPNDTQVVYSVNVDKFMGSTLGGAAFRASSGYQTAVFRDVLGLPLEKMSRFIRAESLKNKWVFNIVQMFPSHTLTTDAMKAKLGSQKGPKSPVKGHEYYLLAPNELLDGLSALDFNALFNPNAQPARVTPSTMAWHLYNEQTLIVAEVNQLEQFLQSDRQPTLQTQSSEQPGGGNAGFGPMGPAGFGPMGPMGGAPGNPTGAGVGFGPMGGGAPGNPTGAGVGFGPMGPKGGGGPPGNPTGAGVGFGPMGGGGPPGNPTGAGVGFGPMGGGTNPMAPALGGAGPMAPALGGAGPMGGGFGGGNAAFTDRATYLTVSPELKRMLDRMEEATQPVIFSCAGRDLESVSPKLVDTVRAATTLGALIPLPTVVAAGMGLHKLTDDRVTGIAALELKHEQDARALDDTLQKNVLAKAADMLGRWMKTTFEAAGADSGGNRFGPMGGFGPFGPMGGFGPAGPMGGFGPAGPMGGFGPAGPMGGFGPGRPGGGGPPPGAPGAAGGGGVGPGAPPAPGGGGFAPNLPGGPGGFGPGRPMGPGAGSTPSSETAKSSLRTWFQGKIVFISIDAEINPDTDRKIRQEIEQQVVRLKGSNDVAAMTRPRWHELAGTVIQLKAQKRTLRGTHALAADNSGAVFVTRPPSQRVSWMVELLPYLDKQDIYAEIDPKLSWRDEKNLRAGTNWVPQFLNPMYPRSSWQARIPSLPGYQLGATHYTALGGVGLDAAELEDTPANRKRLGLFGYDRPTNFDDVPDGLSNTIYLITTPPNLPRPWIAGGGATVQGVPESNSLAPFVTDFGGGKRGAYILMGDGSVRFLKSDTPDAVFKALTTKAGGEDFGVLEAVAPKQNAPGDSRADARPATSSRDAKKEDKAGDRK